jgi:hypothetical protein
MTAARFRAVKIVVVVGIVASALHFADNAIEITHYNEPGWITSAGVVVSWFVVTAIAAVVLLRRRADAAFFVFAGAYALVLLSGLLHYAYGPPMNMPMRSNVTVLIEAATGAALVVALLARRARLKL